MPESKEETLSSSAAVDEDTLMFDNTVGALQDILMDAKFCSMQNKFLDENCGHFDPKSDENKFIYTKIFKSYVEMLEKSIHSELKMRVDGYSERKFHKMIKERPEEVTGDVFDMLISLADFKEFRDLMFAHKMSKNNGGIGTILLENTLSTCAPTPLLAVGGKQK
eukprot:CAMPEP_0197525362 /NCGR_PEP_ID=MMETSP1318-20131121/11442_1 /TAXON_ID=552666 /ORGANISM="Partenskyella glossopodia, Strain RCC365" /LENGTH=164 /DNA_ID=CAMNT_0043078661 /DNA_START=79 /DNA_END=573 /DNA_ORIENTATION=+